MRPYLRCPVIACVLLVGVATHNAEPVQARHARVELLANQNAVTATHELLLGVHFALEKDWHIYWVNPGDSGQPPVFKWNLPFGFTAGEIQWPLPEKLRRATLADYGYQDDVVLLVPIRVPPGMKAGTKVDIGLQAKWLICRDICIPDHADLHLTMPAPAGGTQSDVLDQARKRLPRPWPHSWKASALSEKDDFVLSINAGKPIQTAEFYPLVPEQIENAAAQPLQSTPQGAKITLKKSDQLLKPIAVLKGVLVLGNGESYQIQAAVTAAQVTRHNN